MSRQTSRGEATVRQLCAALCISRAAFYAASLALVERTPRRRPARPGSWATDHELEAGIRRVVAAHAAWGVRKVWATLRREKVRASRNRVWRMMRALGLVLEPIQEREHPSRQGHVSVPGSNRRWGLDLTTVFVAEVGTVAVVPLVECGDRLALSCAVTVSQESAPVLSPLKQALIREFGSPAAVPPGLELRSDHGPQFTGSDCHELCKAWGIDHTFAPVGRPTGNAVAERFIQTLKVELLWTRDWQTMEELRAAVQEFIWMYNHERPHQALNWQTPAERRAMNLNQPAAVAA